MKSKLALGLMAFSALETLQLSACDPGNTGGTDNPPPAATYTVGGNVSGLSGGAVVLSLNGQESLPVSAAGSFTFATKIATGGSYTVTVKTQPSQPPQTCTVMSGTGTVASANVSNVSVACSKNAFPIGGTVTGLSGTPVVLQNNGGDDLTVNADGTFTFQTPVASGATYAVTVKTQPLQGTTKLCTVTQDTGTVSSGAVTSVTVNCATPMTCKAIKDAVSAAVDGDYMIDPDGPGTLSAITAFCDMTTDGGGYTEYAVKGTGISTTRYDQQNSCTAVGLKMVVARSKAHMGAMIAKYGNTYFATVPGVYGLAAGGYTNCVMNSKDATCAANWKSIDGGAWWARDTKHSEPNGDYTPGCWLGTYTPVLDGNGDIGFNDANCTYATGTSYICSDNAKP